MAQNWNYSELSAMAKANGGPKVLVESLIQSGVSQGRKSMYPAVIGALMVGPLIWEGGKCLWKKYCTNGNQNLSEADVKKVKEELIQGIREYDTNCGEAAPPDVVGD